MPDNPYQAPQVIADTTDVDGTDPKLERSASMLRATKPWVRFVSVIMFICSAFMVLGGTFMIATGGLGASEGPFAEGLGAIFGIVYVAMALFYIIPAVFLWQYADRIALFVHERSTGALASALEAQKSFWKFVGVLMSVFLTLYAIIIFVAIVGGFASSM